MPSAILHTILLTIILLFIGTPPAQATSLICWDGTWVVSVEECDPKPEPRTFKIWNISTEGAEANVYQVDGNIHVLSLNAAGEMGQTDFDYVARPGRLEISQLRYNRPIYHDAFDFDLSETTAIGIPVEKDEKGIPVFIDSRKTQIVFLNCLYGEISLHLGAHPDTAPDLFSACGML